MTVKGLFFTCVPYFLILIKCGPGSRGTNDAKGLLSDVTLNFRSSSWRLDGLLRVAVSLLRSSGMRTLGISRRQSQGVPTALTASAASTMIEKGLPGTSFHFLSGPFFLTLIWCSPGSWGTNDTPRELSLVISSLRGSSLSLFGRLRNPLSRSLSRSSGSFTP